MNGVQQNILKFLRQTEKTSGKERQNGHYVGNNRKRKMDQLFEKGEKRKRSSNFHTQEIDSLLTLVKKDKRTIECKKTDQTTNTYKDMAWKKVALTFNERNLTKRSDKQLRSKWETLKKNARREYGANKLSETSEKVLKILDLVEDSYLDIEIPLQLKEEPFFDDTNYEENENSCEVDQRIPVPVQLIEPQQCGKKEGVFQNKTSQSSNSSTNDKPFEDAFPQESERSLATIMSPNVQWKPITIAQAFVAPSGLLLPHCVSRTDEEIHTNNVKEKGDISVSSGVGVLDAITRKIVLSKPTSLTRGTQCDSNKSAERKLYKKRLFCCHLFTGHHSNYLQKKLLLEDNKRRKEKHQIEMEILRTELLIKKRQFEKLE